MPKFLQTLSLLTLVGGLATPVQAQTCTGLYSLARAAVPSLASTGDLAFIAYQQDTPKHAGTLQAFPLKAEAAPTARPLGTPTARPQKPIDKPGSTPTCR